MMLTAASKAKKTPTRVGPAVVVRAGDQSLA
jgi:hypothetical protein